MLGIIFRVQPWVASVWLLHSPTITGELPAAPPHPSGAAPGGRAGVQCLGGTVGCCSSPTGTHRDNGGDEQGPLRSPRVATRPVPGGSDQLLRSLRRSDAIAER